MLSLHFWLVGVGSEQPWAARGPLPAWKLGFGGILQHCVFCMLPLTSLLMYLFNYKATGDKCKRGNSLLFFSHALSYFQWQWLSVTLLLCYLVNATTFSSKYQVRGDLTSSQEITHLTSANRLVSVPQECLHLVMFICLCLVFSICRLGKIHLGRR